MVDPGNVLGYKAVHHTDLRSGNKESGANVKQLGRVFLAAVLAVPMVARCLPRLLRARREEHRCVALRYTVSRIFAASQLSRIPPSPISAPLTIPSFAPRLSKPWSLQRRRSRRRSNTGRILTVVNQKIAFGSGYIPCSTIKPTVALAALEENVITRDTMLKVGRRKYMNLTEAMAHSNNVFFEEWAAAWASTRFPLRAPTRSG